MAASLSSGSRIWVACRYCTRAIWKYPNGKLWRDDDNNGTCYISPTSRHAPEY